MNIDSLKTELKSLGLEIEREAESLKAKKKAYRKLETSITELSKLRPQPCFPSA
jgi:hypothetical protein